MTIPVLTRIIERHAAGFPGLIAALIGRTTDGKTVARVSFTQEKISLELLGRQASDLLQASNLLCQVVRQDQETSYLLTGFPEMLLVIKSFPEAPYFVLLLVRRIADLKTISACIRAILTEARPLLPPVQENTSSLAQALVLYAKRYTPDPVVTLRLSLKTGIDCSRLERGNLDDQELSVLYKAVADLLGVDHLPVALPTQHPLSRDN